MQKILKNSRKSLPDTGNLTHCNCDYCRSIKRHKRESRKISCGEEKKQLNPIRSKSYDSFLANTTNGKWSEELELGAAVHHYYNSWQSEKFRTSALERENERLEARIKSMQVKLDREILQQIKISFEWRKAVINLVDENTRLKKLILSSRPTS